MGSTFANRSRSKWCFYFLNYYFVFNILYLSTIIWPYHLIPNPNLCRVPSIKTLQRFIPQCETPNFLCRSTFIFIRK